MHIAYTLRFLIAYKTKLQEKVLLKIVSPHSIYEYISKAEFLFQKTNNYLYCLLKTIEKMETTTLQHI